MLQAIRSKATSLVVKMLFVVLVLSFGIWGIGDIFRNRGADTTVATVGDTKIDVQELNQAVRQDEQQLRQMLRGAPLDPEQLKQFGIVDTALQRLINRDLIDLEVNHLRLAVGDDAVYQAIASNPAFRNESGGFDRQRYKLLLDSQRMSEQQFEAQIRTNLVRVHLNQALVDGVAAAPELVDTLYRARAERRVADIVALPPSAAGDPGNPSDADLAAFYDQHKESFRTPELRSFDVGLLLVDDVAAGIKVPDDKLRDEYQNRIAEFQTPEQRHVLQILAPDEAKAKEAEVELASGKDFAKVAADVAGNAPDTIDLGFLKRTDIPPLLADIIFSLKTGETSQPVQSTFGWHILRITEVKPEETQSFEAAKGQLATEVARDMAGDQISKMANQIDDALAGGSSFAEVTKRFDLKMTKIENADEHGRNADGAPANVPQPTTEILRTAFGTAEGKASQLNDIQENGYYILQVDKVTPSTVKPLDDVRAQAIQLWQADKRGAALEKLAQDMTDQVMAGRIFRDVAAKQKLSVVTSAPLPRAGGDAKVPPALVAKIFEAKPGTAVFAKSNDGFVVAQVKEVLPPDPSKESSDVAQLSQQLAPALKDDLLQEFDQALRERYPVHIDQAAVAQAF